MKCTACGKENTHEGSFCAYCGAKLVKLEQKTVSPAEENPYQPRRMPNIFAEPVHNENKKKPVFMFEDELTEQQEPEKKNEVNVVDFGGRINAEDTEEIPMPEPEEEIDEEYEEYPDEETDEEPVRPVRHGKREPKVYDDDPFGGQSPDEDEDDEEEEGGKAGHVFAIIIAVLTLLIILAGCYVFLFYTSAGSRMRANMDFAADYGDYVLNGDWQLEKGNESDASASYYKAFRLADSDLGKYMELAQRFEKCDTARAEQLYLFLIEKYPEENDPYDYLMAFYAKEKKQDEYNALQTYRAQHQTGYVAPAQQLEIPDMPTCNQESGRYTASLKVQLSAEDGCTVYFTIDGTEPTSDSQMYTGQFTLYSGKHTLKAIAVNVTGVASAVLEREFNIS